MPMTRIVVLSEAQAELREAVRWYKQRSSQVARKFALSIRSAVFAIREHPDRYARWGDVYRHYLIDGFPYFVAYRSTPEEIVIVAIRHTSQDQGAWQSR